MLAARPDGAHAAKSGAVVDLTWGLSRAEVDRTVAWLRDAKIRVVRVTVPWNSVEWQGPGRYNEGQLKIIDYAVGKARSAGMQVVMTPMGTPQWARNGDSTLSPPRDPRTYGRFVRFLAGRYKKRGVTTYEIWNEPNLDRFWRPVASATGYTRLLKYAYKGIKKAGRKLRVVLGGLSPQGSYGYLKRLYKAGARPYFDSMGIHVYPRGDPYQCQKGPGGRRVTWSFCVLDEVRQIMKSRGDARKDVWVTEYGYSTCRPDNAGCNYAGGVWEQQQGPFLVRAKQRFDKRRWVKAAFIYQFRDWTTDGSVSWWDWEENLGLLRRDFQPKPAYWAVRAYNSSR